jgi:long-chain acyl-CoA synthetase
MDWDKRQETLVSLLLKRVRQSGPATALYVHRGARPAVLAARPAVLAARPAGDPVDGASSMTGEEFSPPGFEAITWNELAYDVRRVAWALGELGLGDGDRVAQVSGNRYLWIVVDLAIHLAGGVHVAMHSALAPEQMAWQIRDSESRLVIGLGASPFFARGQDLLADWPIRLVSDDDLTSLAATATLENTESLERRSPQSRPPATRDRLATILYTSGTTGEPKGVMLSHGNLAFNALAALETYRVEPDDLQLCWLPLSHIFARTSDLYISIASGVPLGLAESRETLLSDIAALRPTLMRGVPYFFDKLARYLIQQGRGDEPGALARLLGGRMRMLCSGGAPLPDHTARFFQSQGLLLLQGYGLTESSPIITTASRDNHRIGTVGPPIPGVELRIADDGEVLTRGDHVMLGYWKRPAETAAAIDDGWLRTGDLGELVEGHLRIVGRKKELIVLSSGKKVAPTSVECRLTSDPLIAQAVLVGDSRKFLTALIVPDLDRLRAELAARRTNELEPAERGPESAQRPKDSPSDKRPVEPPAAGSPLDGSPLDEPSAPALFAERIARCLADCAEWEQVRKFTLVSRPFSVENGQLTPTLKLRREAIEQRYAAEIQQMYADCASAERPDQPPAPLARPL